MILITYELIHTPKAMLSGCVFYAKKDIGAQAKLNIEDFYLLWYTVKHQDKTKQ